MSFNPFARGECACLAVATAGCKTVEQESRQTEAATCYKDGVAMPLRSERFKVQARRLPAELGQHALVGGVKKKNKERNVNQSGDTRFGLGQLLRARIRPMAGDSPSGYSLTGQSGLVFDVGSEGFSRAVLAVAMNTY